MFGAGDDVPELGDHLAAVANAEGETVAALEEGLEHVLQLLVIEDALGPARTGTEDIAVGEAPAGDEAGAGVRDLDALVADVAALQLLAQRQQRNSVLAQRQDVRQLAHEVRGTSQALQGRLDCVTQQQLQ